MRRFVTGLTLSVLFVIVHMPGFFLYSQTQNQTQTQVTKQEPVKQEPVESPSPMPMSDSASFVKSLMALTFVLGLIFLTAYLYKKMAGIKTRGFRTNRVPIQVVGTLPLGDKKFLSIVEIQGNHFFLGISQDSINLLSTLELELTEEKTEDSSGNFENIFAKARALMQNRLKK